MLRKKIKCCHLLNSKNCYMQVLNPSSVAFQLFLIPPSCISLVLIAPLLPPPAKHAGLEVPSMDICDTWKLQLLSPLSPCPSPPGSY